ncbi:MAG: deoxyribonuclease IV [Eubacteriales bacterium]|jgi:deoxyribonuclease-4
MIYIGNHISTSGGYEAMGHNEDKLGGTTFAFFTRNPRGGQSKDVPQEDMDNLQKFLQEKGWGKLVAHAPYTMNLCSGKESVREFAKNVFQEDLAKMERLPGHYFNFHPGSHVGQGAEKGIGIISDVLNESMKPDQKTTVLLETMAGKGSEIGRTFEELREIIDRVKPELQPRLGVCFDTCHVWDGGYDIVNDLDGVLQKFDDVIGLDRLCAVHLNDSKNPLGAHKDRHEKLGLGCIGKPALARVIQHPALQGKPFILETPNEDEGYIEEIAWVKDQMV